MKMTLGTPQANIRVLVRHTQHNINTPQIPGTINLKLTPLVGTNETFFEQRNRTQQEGNNHATSG